MPSVLEDLDMLAVLHVSAILLLARGQIGQDQGRLPKQPRRLPLIYPK